MAQAEVPYTVVVGVSATSLSPTALRWGKAQAELNHGRLVAVRVYRMPNPQAAPSGTTSQRIPDATTVQTQQDDRLARDVEEVLGPDHGAELRAVRGGKRRGLLNEAAQADLLVIDAPRAPSMSPLLAQRIVYAASCPVVVMPPAIAGAEEPGWAKAGRAMGRAAVRAAGTSGRPGYRPPSTPAS